MARGLTFYNTRYDGLMLGRFIQPGALVPIFGIPLVMRQSLVMSQILNINYMKTYSINLTETQDERDIDNEA